MVSGHLQAIALSLKDCPMAKDTPQGGPSQSSDAGVVDDTKGKRRGKTQIQEGAGRKKRKKPVYFSLWIESYTMLKRFPSHVFHCLTMSHFGYG